MAVTVVWSDQAKKTFDENVSYLEESWTGRELSRFIHRTEYVVLNLEDNPELYQLSNKSKNIRRAILNKRITLYYRYFPSKKVVVLLSFWNSYKDDRSREF